MSTTATRKQSQAIRDQMRMIRSDLPYSVDTAREEVAQLTDWKYYVRTFPIAAVLGAAAVGYAVVPAKRSGHTSSHGSEQGSPTKKPSIVEGLVAAVAAMALRNGTSMVAQHLSGQLFGGAGNPQSGSDSKHADQRHYAGEQR